ncbi:YidC/Oxa1 family membrane protein insertase [Christensenellaceae bacterium OttesenSCG-928-M15]|nr:YidC/Oxa1 family membrane protein insertase [Christensenellaceae bacterium OttesenSCG-928-M15]
MQGDFFLTQGIFLGMRWLYEVITNQHVVLTIIISTILIRGLTIFGDIKSRKSNMKMQAIQPDLDKLKKKYANNPQKLQQAQSKLMRERGVSMWGGCLPMLITMPLFFCFIAAFRQWGYEQMVRLLIDLEQNPGSMEMFSTFKFLWVTNIWQPDVGHMKVIMDSSQFFAIDNLQNLMYFAENPAAKALFEQWGFFVEKGVEASQMAVDKYNSLIAPILAQYEGFANGWYVLPVLAGATTFLSSWAMQRRQKKTANTDADAGGAANAAQSTNKMMMYFMPALSAFFCLSNNAAFAVYWTISNIVSFLTNLLINRMFEKEQQKRDALEGGSI